MLVQSHHSFWGVANFDPSTGELAEYWRRSAGDPPLYETRGAFLNLSGGRVVFYRHDGSLWLRISDTVRNLEDPTIGVRWNSSGEVATLELLDRGNCVALAAYPPSNDGGADDPTPFADLEDLDFGLFVRNVLENLSLIHI